MRNIEHYAKEYLKEDFEQYQVKYRRKKVLAALRKFNHKRILEIGCGMEPLFQFMNDDYEEYIIIEPSEGFCEHAEKLRGSNSKIKILNGFFEQSLDQIKGQIDFIICSSLLHEVEEPMGFLKSIAGICDEKVTVHVNVPNAKSLHRLIAQEMGMIEDVYIMSERNIRLQQHMVYDMDRLVESVEKSGFEVIEKGSYFVKPFSHTQMYKMLEKNIISEEVLDGLAELIKYLPEFGSEIYVNLRLNMNS